ncbi:lantibiotic ABC transporter ATP-binding protein [Bombilactobacillus bombi]|uniref:Lantibiotic ABC transporter ATP-binding protein n=1 Tax=Bombilactobacillus bombi TaxID=1303590 RepID=A0A417ZJR2_9LACO|nr:lantibiotic protection ABC transporter ATP-binding protein [Bombilactobacillus bombi]RHW52071.1 lantibiotic ABC transporter ATP-binding protein [Bombilactobacillus bombi]
MTNIIETHNLTKQFKHEKILNEVSLHVPENSVYGLLGPNGAGKSTLLKLLTGVWHPNSGEIFFKNHPLQTSDLQQMGAMIEGPAIYSNLMAYENLKVMALLLHVNDQRIDQVLKIVNLTNTGNKIVKQFSVGMKQRLGIGMALMNNPRLLILDEPTNGLDPLGIQELRDFISSLPAQGITVIVSSHILSEVQQMADVVGIIVQGRLSYEQANDKQAENLEQVFMQIVEQEHKNHASNY